jgi:hypothetical protein
MPLRRIGEKIVEGKNDSSVGTQNFLIIYIFLWDGIPRYGSLLLPGLARIDLDIDKGCLWEEIFLPNPRKTSIQLLLEAQQHKKYAQTTSLDDGVSFLF